MVVPFQVQLEQVVAASLDDLRDAIAPVEIAIEEAWATTRRQIQDAAFDHRISQTAFAQFLVHNVRNEIFRLGQGDGQVFTDLVPNRRGSAHHVVVRFRNFWITVSAVKSRSERPRPARFRADYARRQMRFIVNEENNYFEAAPPPEDARDDIHTYIQMLHGPDPSDRQMHGFTLVAFTNRFGEYNPRPIDIRDFLNSEDENNDHPGVEIIEEAFRIEINGRMLEEEE